MTTTATAHDITTVITATLHLWERKQRDASRGDQLSKKAILLKNIDVTMDSHKQDEGNK